MKNTKDFIHKIEGITTNKNIILVTMDVSSLYTNIPNHKGILSVIETLRPKHNGQVSLLSIQKLLRAVLHMNNFEFNKKHYLQIGGTAMGTKLAPSYANIFMGRLEKKLLAKAATLGLKLLLYLRYIDDIFIIWDQGADNLEFFIKLANEFYHTIKFTAEFSTESVNYLDTTVKIRKDLDGKNTIYTDLYTKDTDTHNYLHFTSSHPIHCK